MRPLPLALACCALARRAWRRGARATGRRGAEPRPTPAPRAGRRRTPTPTPSRRPPPLPAAGPGLAVGVTEFNPNLVASPAERPLPAPWAGVRDALGAIQPAVLPARDRLVRDPALAGRARGPERAADAAACAPVGPCLGWAGVRDQLRALASRQREGGWQALVVITVRRRTGPPRRPAAASGPTRRARARAAARRRAARLPPADRRRARRRRARRAPTCASGAPGTSRTIPAFVSPQRAACDPASPSARARRLRASWRARSPRRSPTRPATSSSCSARPPGSCSSTRLVTTRAGVHRRPAAGRRLRLDGLVAARLHRRRRPRRRRRDRARRPRLPAAAHDLDHRDRRRPGAEGPVRRDAIADARDGLPRAPRAARPLVATTRA